MEHGKVQKHFSAIPRIANSLLVLVTRVPRTNHPPTIIIPPAPPRGTLATKNFDLSFLSSFPVMHHVTLGDAAAREREETTQQAGRAALICNVPYAKGDKRKLPNKRPQPAVALPVAGSAPSVALSSSSGSERVVS